VAAALPPEVCTVPRDALKSLGLNEEIVAFAFMPRTMTVTLLNDGGKYVAVDLKHIAKGESCRMD
jgi:hypothetical protein